MKIIKKNPKRLAIAACAAALALSVVALAGCGSSNSAPAASSDAGSAAAAAPAAATSVEITSADVEAVVEALVPKVQSGTVTTYIDMTGYDAGKDVRVWVPYPSTGSYQAISDHAIVAEGADRAEITTDALGNRMAYIEWSADADPATRLAEVSFHATRNEAIVDVDSIVESGDIPQDIAD